MNNDGKKDSLSSMNDLFGTKINNEQNVKQEQIDDTKFQDIPDINKAMLPKEDVNKDDKDTPQQKEEESSSKQTDENSNEKPMKFINDDYVNEENTEEKPLIEKPDDNEIKSNNGMINELIDIAKNFDFSKVKLNIATIAFIISLIGSMFYNLIITLPALLLSYLALKQAEKGKLDKQSKLFSVLALVLSTIGLISIVMSYISRILTF